MPSLSVTYWSALVVAGALALFFGGRQIGAALRNRRFVVLVAVYGVQTIGIAVITAGIPFAALMAERMALPMTYVRKKPKGYGRNARIEGAMSEGERVLLVEDLTTDGGSKLSFVDAIRDTGATCGHTAVIFYYGIFYCF